MSTASAGSATPSQELARQLADPAMYADFARVQAVGNDMETVQNQLAEKTDRLNRLATS